MATNGKTVLLVEDNEDNRIVYSTILRHFGYEVSEALNGEEGIAKARAERPDLILMDISIPIILRPVPPTMTLASSPCTCAWAWMSSIGLGGLSPRNRMTPRSSRKLRPAKS